MLFLESAAPRVLLMDVTCSEKMTEKQNLPSVPVSEPRRFLCSEPAVRAVRKTSPAVAILRWCDFLCPSGTHLGYLTECFSFG